MDENITTGKIFGRGGSERWSEILEKRKAGIKESVEYKGETVAMVLEDRAKSGRVFEVVSNMGIKSQNEKGVGIDGIVDKRHGGDGIVTFEMGRQVFGVRGLTVVEGKVTKTDSGGLDRRTRQLLGSHFYGEGWSSKDGALGLNATDPETAFGKLCVGSQVVEAMVGMADEYRDYLEDKHTIKTFGKSMESFGLTEEGRPVSVLHLEVVSALVNDPVLLKESGLSDGQMQKYKELADRFGSFTADPASSVMAGLDKALDEAGYGKGRATEYVDELKKRLSDMRPILFGEEK